MYIPNYNSKDYIRECIESALALTYPDFEILINDDGSTDGSLEICEEYAQQDDRIKIFYKSKPSGSCGDINTTVGNAKGTIIAKLDSDDIIIPHFWETVLPYFEDDNVGFVRIGLIISKGEDRLKLAPFPWNSMLDLFLSNKIFGCSPFRLKMFNDVRGWDIGRLHPDWDFWIRCVLRGWKWNDCIEPLYVYRKRKDSLIGSLTAEKQERDLTYYRDKYKDVLRNFGMKSAEPYSSKIGDY